MAAVLRHQFVESRLGIGSCCALCGGVVLAPLGRRAFRCAECAREVHAECARAAGRYCCVGRSQLCVSMGTTKVKDRAALDSCSGARCFRDYRRVWFLLTGTAALFARLQKTPHGAVRLRPLVLVHKDKAPQITVVASGGLKLIECDTKMTGNLLKLDVDDTCLAAQESGIVLWLVYLKSTETSTRLRWGVCADAVSGADLDKGYWRPARATISQTD
eukprot:TRINITY_DN6179_c0_g1_i1.p1 TRINITY_DN6179_c0_g1~~TRINITY_DN6179_c0_g1_i1.p1  ORF type:complete len:240 (-),score=57.48 TRINITY_DN6179_c0_g1_i1:474-1124(-)